MTRLRIDAPTLLALLAVLLLVLASARAWAWPPSDNYFNVLTQMRHIKKVDEGLQAQVDTLRAELTELRERVARHEQAFPVHQYRVSAWSIARCRDSSGYSIAARTDANVTCNGCLDLMVGDTDGVTP